MAKKQGKTRFMGISTHTNMANCINAAVKAKVWDAILTRYSYKDQNDELNKAIANAKAAGVGIIAMKTQMGNFPNPEGGLTPHQAALKWVLTNKNITCAVPGMRNFAQLEQNFAIIGKRVNVVDRRRLKLYAEATAGLYCTACGACDGFCPKGVDVSQVRRCVMYLDGYKDPGLARENYRALRANAAPCIDCDECVVPCVNRVALQPVLSSAHRRLA